MQLVQIAEQTMTITQVFGMAALVGLLILGLETVKSSLNK